MTEQEDTRDSAIKALFHRMQPTDVIQVLRKHGYLDATSSVEIFGDDLLDEFPAEELMDYMFNHHPVDLEDWLDKHVQIEMSNGRYSFQIPR
jgi:hypothetical protein